MALDVLKQLCRHARTGGDEVAIREIAQDDHAERTVTFAQLARMVGAFSRRIEAVVAPGDVVIICQPNRIDCTVSFLAALHARTIGFLINPSVSNHELQQAAAATATKAVIATPGANDALSDFEATQLSTDALFDEADRPRTIPDPPPDHEGSGLMLLSSGTTGDPKIAFRDGMAVDAVARNVSQAIGMSHGDRVLGMVPLCHSYGLEHGLLAPTYSGACVHLCQGFDTKIVAAHLGDITVLPGVPSLFEMLAQRADGAAVSSIRCGYSAGSVLPMSVFDACRQRLGLRVGQLYGSTEVGSVTFNDPHARGHDPMSVGLPMQGVLLTIVDPDAPDPSQSLPPGVEGELIIHSPSMLSRYVGQTEPPYRDGFFRSGDLGRLDSAGALTITGRIKLLIDVGAWKVNPVEVETALGRHEGVMDCVVLALPVTDTVSRVRALVVPVDRNDPPSIESLRGFVRSRLSAHKVPRVIEIVESLPKSPTGKILRRQIAS